MKSSLKGQQAEIAVPFLISNGGTGLCRSQGTLYTTTTEKIAIFECVAKAIGSFFFFQVRFLRSGSNA